MKYKIKGDLENRQNPSYIITTYFRKLFHFEYIECVDKDKQYMFNLDLNHWFTSVAKDVLDRNSKIEQNNEWGGRLD